MKSSKNLHLVGILEDAIESMCHGIGTKRVKLFLNSKVKAGDRFAFLLRELLECETLNINAKRYNNTMRFNYRESYYAKKHERINALLESIVSDKPDGLDFWIEDSDVDDTDYIVYFERPSFGQVSFHTDIDFSLRGSLEVREDKWDGLVNSTLGKLEKAIMDKYGDELREKHADIVSAYDEAKRIADERDMHVSEIVSRLNENVASIYSLEGYSEEEHRLASQSVSYRVRLHITEYILSTIEGLDFSVSDVDSIKASVNGLGIPYLNYYINESSIIDMIRKAWSDEVDKKVAELGNDVGVIFSLGHFPKIAHDMFIQKTGRRKVFAKEIVTRYFDKLYDGAHNVTDMWSRIESVLEADGYGYLYSYISFETFVRALYGVFGGWLNQAIEGCVMPCDTDIEIIISIHSSPNSSKFSKEAQMKIPKMICRAFGNDSVSILVARELAKENKLYMELINTYFNFGNKKKKKKKL